MDEMRMDEILANLSGGQGGGGGDVGAALGLSADHGALFDSSVLFDLDPSFMAGFSPLVPSPGAPGQSSSASPSASVAAAAAAAAAAGAAGAAAAHQPFLDYLAEPGAQAQQSLQSPHQQHHQHQQQRQQQQQQQAIDIDHIPESPGAMHASSADPELATPGMQDLADTPPVPDLATYPPPSAPPAAVPSPRDRSGTPITAAKPPPGQLPYGQSPVNATSQPQRPHLGQPLSSASALPPSAAAVASSAGAVAAGKLTPPAASPSPGSTKIRGAAAAAAVSHAAMLAASTGVPSTGFASSPQGPHTPGPQTPGPHTPGPRTPGPHTPGPDTPGPTFTAPAGSSSPSPRSQAQALSPNVLVALVSGQAPRDVMQAGTSAVDDLLGAGLSGFGVSSVLANVDGSSPGSQQQPAHLQSLSHTPAGPSPNQSPVPTPAAVPGSAMTSFPMTQAAQTANRSPDAHMSLAHDDPFAALNTPGTSPFPSRDRLAGLEDITMEDIAGSPTAPSPANQATDMNEQPQPYTDGLDQEVSNPPKESEQQSPLQQQDLAHSLLQSQQSPLDLERRRLREPADKVIATSWRTAASPMAFVGAARAALQNVGSEGPSDLTQQWQLPSAMEKAFLDALLTRITAGEAASSRLIAYLRHSLVSGLVSQRAVLDACVAPYSGLADRVTLALARVLADMLPYYAFTTEAESLSSEADQLLSAFSLILTCGVTTPSFLHVVATLLSGDRLVAIIRVAARRNPARWMEIQATVLRIESLQSDRGVIPDTQLIPASTCSAASLDLKTGISRLQRGLSMGITSIRVFDSSPQRGAVAKVGVQIQVALTSACQIATFVLGAEVAKSLRSMWHSREPAMGGDLEVLMAIERTAYAFSGYSAGSMPRMGFREKVRACEAIVRYLAVCASEPGAVDNWRNAWGGRERLSRMLRDAVPQVKPLLRSEFSCLMVATAVIGSAAMCLGPAMQLDDPNIGLPISDSSMATRQAEMDELVEDVMTEVIGFAVGSLEEAAVAEEIPLWRSFGAWILLLASRCGAMLRASRCDHIRAAGVLRAWSGSSSGSSGAHAVSTHPSQSHPGQHYQSNGSGSSSSRPSSHIPSSTSNAGSGAPSSHHAGSAPSNGPGTVPHNVEGAGQGMGGSYGGGPVAAPTSSARYPPSANHNSSGSHSGSVISNSSAADGVRAYATTISLAVLDSTDTRGDDRTLHALCTDLMQ